MSSENATPENEATEQEQQPKKKAKAHEISVESLAIEHKKEIDELNDKMMRIAADAQNIKRRAELDVQKARDFSVESFAKDMTPVLENLFRALENIPAEQLEQDEALKSLFEGVEMTKNEMVRALEKQHVKRIYPEGEAFDHNLHQAMTQIPETEHEAGTVVQVIQAGYTLKERLLNPALVAVAK